MTTTDYSGGFIYENNALQHFAHEEGRVRKSGANLVYDYYIKDHLGNTRMTLTEATDITEYRATMETGTSSSGTNMETYEENLFLNVEEVCSTQPGINTTDVPGFTDDKVAALNGSVAARRAGPAKLLAVTAGDQVSVTVDSYHTGNTSTGVQTKATMVSAIAGLFGSLSGGGVEQQAVYDLFNGVSTTGFLYSGSTSTSAKAYLNMLVFDQDFNFVGVGGFDRADQTSGYQTLSVSATINQGGYVYVYLSNESTANFEVYFDNLNITHTKGAILQEDHYYPFGLNISALSSTAPLSKPNQFKYNGKELQADFDMNWYDYGARNYDAQIGRFMQVDPVADVYLNSTPYHYVLNNPVKYVDPTGMFTELFDNNGNKIGEDEKGNDGNVSIISDKEEAKRIKKNTKAGQIASADDVASGIQTTKGVLTEALDVLARTEANGGLNEEISIVTGNGKVIRGQTGPDPIIEEYREERWLSAKAPIPELPEGLNEANSTNIHSHPTGVFEKDGLAFPISANDGSGQDGQFFKRFRTNIIVGKLGALSQLERKPDGTLVDKRPTGAVFYNQKGGQIGQLKSSAIKKIIK